MKVRPPDTFAAKPRITCLILPGPTDDHVDSDGMLWEAVFLLLVLKIPIVYMCLVVWWAIRAEPGDEQPATLSTVSDTPSSPPPFAPEVGARRRPPGPRRRDGRPRRDRLGPRPAAARGEARR